MKDVTKIPLICFATKEDKKTNQDLFPWRWEAKTSWRPPIDNISMHEKFQRSTAGLNRQLEQIQMCRNKRNSITDWASNLRFLTGPTPNVIPDEAMIGQPKKCVLVLVSSGKTALSRAKELCQPIVRALLQLLLLLRTPKSSAWYRRHPTAITTLRFLTDGGPTIPVQKQRKVHKTLKPRRPQTTWLP